MVVIFAGSATAEAEGAGNAIPTAVSKDARTTTAIGEDPVAESKHHRRPMVFCASRRPRRPAAVASRTCTQWSVPRAALPLGLGLAPAGCLVVKDGERGGGRDLLHRVRGQHGRKFRRPSSKSDPSRCSRLSTKEEILTGSYRSLARIDIQSSHNTLQTMFTHTKLKCNPPPYPL